MWLEAKHMITSQHQSNQLAKWEQRVHNWWRIKILLSLNSEWYGTNFIKTRRTIHLRGRFLTAWHPRGTILLDIILLERNPLERNPMGRIALKLNPLGMKALWGECPVRWMPRGMNAPGMNTLLINVPRTKPPRMKDNGIKTKILLRHLPIHSYSLLHTQWFSL